MRVLIESVADSQGTTAAAQLCTYVFERELGMSRPPAVDPFRSRVLLVRLHPNRKPVGTLTVLETTGERDLHAKYGLTFPDSAKVARYTKLAILPAYRGLGLSLRLMYEARRRFVLPERFEYTWLLFDAERAGSSNLSMLLDFIPRDTVFLTEWGRTRVMLRREPQPRTFPAQWVASNVAAEANQGSRGHCAILSPKEQACFLGSVASIGLVGRRDEILSATAPGRCPYYYYGAF